MDKCTEIVSKAGHRQGLLTREALALGSLFLLLFSFYSRQFPSEFNILFQLYKSIHISDNDSYFLFIMQSTRQLHDAVFFQKCVCLFWILIVLVQSTTWRWACSGPGQGWTKKIWMSLNGSHYNVWGTKSKGIRGCLIVCVPYIVCIE